MQTAPGYLDANDCDVLRDDPAFEVTVGRLPETVAELCSQPTMSRPENLPGKTALIRMMDAMVELFCDSFAEVPGRILLDIDDTLDRVHGGQQLSLIPGLSHGVRSKGARIGLNQTAKEPSDFNSLRALAETGGFEPPIQVHPV